MNSAISILIADDHPIVRRGLKEVIEEDSSLTVVAEAGDGNEALSLIENIKPDVAVIDIDMPQADGFEVVRQMRKRRLSTEVVFVTMHAEEDMFNEAMNLGVKAYVLKDSATSDIVASIKSVMSGRSYISPAMSGLVLSRAARASAFAEETPSLANLTPTERKVLYLIAQYKTSKEIAEELFIHHRTVENHRTNICQKLGLHGSHALIKFALKHKSEI